MQLVMGLINFIIHIDKYLLEIINQFGIWTYLILFLIIFCETGLVVTPFLPGDSLIFVIGALGASGVLEFKVMLITLIIAAVGGNTLNYFIGKLIGKKIIEAKKIRIIKKEYLDKTQGFYEKHGGKAMILSRFIPILRTFAPFVAGIGNMSFYKFIIYNIIGGVSWVITFIFAGYFFGNIPVVKNNFTYVIFGIILVSLIPTVVGYLKSRKK